MSISRYDNTTILGSSFFGTQQDYSGIKRDIDSGVIKTFSYMTKPNDRLDILATRFYGEGSYWWIIAIANDIGWALQISAGIQLRIPKMADKILERI